MTITDLAVPAEWTAGPPDLDDISTAEGWKRYVAARDSYRCPTLLSRAEYEALPDGHRSLYDFAREIAVANLPSHDTPMAAALRRQVERTLKTNTNQSKAGVRTGMLVSADAGLGKSTLIREIAASFEERQRGLATMFPNIAGNRDLWLPVAWINVPANVTIKGLCYEILAFFGDVPVGQPSEPVLSRRVRDIMKACGTRLLVLDDITRLNMAREADQITADFIRALMETAATILGIGVNVEASGLLYEGQANADARRALTQTRRRFTVHPLGAFTDETSDTYNGWLSHLRAVEDDLPLLDKAPGMLTGGDTPAYLLRRTNGVIGTLSRLIAEASLDVLGQTPAGPGTGEYLTREVLDDIRLDHAAETPDIPQPVQQPRAAKRRPPRTRNSAFNGTRRPA